MTASIGALVVEVTVAVAVGAVDVAVLGGAVEAAVLDGMAWVDPGLPSPSESELHEVATRATMIPTGSKSITRSGTPSGSD